jgi:hypothetical protein
MIIVSVPGLQKGSLFYDCFPCIIRRLAKEECAVIELGAVVIDHADVFDHQITDFHAPSNAEGLFV